MAWIRRHLLAFAAFAVLGYMLVPNIIVAIFSFGVHPSGMTNAVSRPQAMIAPMLGMIMFERKVPNFWTCTRAPVRGAASVVVAIRTLPTRELV